MTLCLKRPLVVLDFESTGLNPRYDRIVEIGALKIYPDGTTASFHKLVNPERPIPSDVTEIHGIDDDDVSQAPCFRDVASEFLGFLRGADLAGFGIEAYDLPLLKAEFARVGIQFDDVSVRVIDAKNIYHRKEPRTLSAALQFYCNQAHTDAHGAFADVEATWNVLQGQLRRYPDLPDSVDGLAEFSAPSDPDVVDRDGKLRWRDDEVTIDFGQKRGLTLRELSRHEPGYLRWMLNKDFSEDVKRMAQDALNGKFPRRNKED